VACHLNSKLEEHSERDFEHTNHLNKVEKGEWAEFMNDAKREDKAKKRVIDENAYVKEMKSLCYIPAKWLPGFEPAEDEEMDDDVNLDDQPIPWDES
jgi:hypothetical protein